MSHTSESLIANIPVNAVMTAFYLDPDNISFQDYFSLEDGMNRILMYGLCKTQVDQALKLFDLESSEFTKIRSRYYELANLHHPDRNGDQEIMKKINSAYMLLEKIFPAE